MDIREAMNRIKDMQEFKDAFLDKRTSRDFRKFQEFVNLCKGFARLNGERVVSRMSIEKAERIFTESLNTLIQDGDWKYIKSGASKRIAQVHQRLNDYAQTLGREFADVKEMRDKVPFSDKEWEYMINQGWLECTEKNIQKATFIQVLPPDMWDDDNS
jgi:DNA replicative helicase MCM subunit Mcm2 (Cdc46/Mcm family)